MSGPDVIKAIRTLRETSGREPTLADIAEPGEGEAEAEAEATPRGKDRAAELAETDSDVLLVQRRADLVSYDTTLAELDMAIATHVSKIRELQAELAEKKAQRRDVNRVRAATAAFIQQLTEDAE